MEYTLSVRQLVDFLLRSGSIDSRGGSSLGRDRRLEGGRVHRQLQKQAGEGYRAEVPLSATLEVEGITFTVSGRADGVITGEDGGITVDEIKSTTRPPELITGEEEAHWGQGICYGYMLCREREELHALDVRLTYYEMDTGQLRQFVRRFTCQELEGRFTKLLTRYARWARLDYCWRESRREGLDNVRFPFPQYRAGQRLLAESVFRTIRAGERLYCSAPTGIGKTISTLFPALKAMGLGLGDKLFYLTAKTITRQAAVDAVSLLRRGNPGLCLRSITFTAKDKVCFLPQRNCTPEACPYADGFYDRVENALYDILTGPRPDLDRESLEQYAREHTLCPYELALELSRWCDLIICDYNYLFDPVVHLQRYFEGGGGEYVFLIDEAHNLVDRGREMYSAELRRGDFRALHKAIPKTHTALRRAVNGVVRAFLPLRREAEGEKETALTLPAPPEELTKPLQTFLRQTEFFLEDHRGTAFEQDLLAAYFAARFYLATLDYYNIDYVTLFRRLGQDCLVKLFCTDPSARLAEAMDKGRAAVLFSATLAPLDYYRDILGGRAGGLRLSLDSPFPRENLGLFVIDGVTTKYHSREMSLDAVTACLYSMAGARPGHYIAYFPSYAYMQMAHARFVETHPGIDTAVQTPEMDEAAREAFLHRFSRDTGGTFLAFCVLGGIYAEGIDLAGDRLIGTAVVGVGLPQVGQEPDVVRDHFNARDGQGYAYAYRYPGMNKVMQAVGRVIRTAEDRGVVLLIDSRYTTEEYLGLFPAHWRHCQVVPVAGIPRALADFWSRDPGWQA